MVEALAYDLLTAYLHEVPLSAFETWQPDKVVKELLQVDPRADRSATISMRKEATATEPAGPWTELGEDRRIKSSRLAKMFHQLGNALHVPTIRQMQKGAAQDNALVRTRAEQLRDELDHVLAAKIWNAHFSVSVTVACTECETPIKRASSYLDNAKQVRCGGCGQAFVVERDGEEYHFVPVKFYWHCDGCGVEREIAESKAKPGLDVSCPKCKIPAILASVTSWRVKQTLPENKQAGEPGQPTA
jgi:Zn finger protein HypA/HybF involved in hydrogenase expression